MSSLSTPRLILRPLALADFDAYAEMCGDAENMRFVGEGRPLTRPEAWRNMAMIAGHELLRGYGIWGMEERATGEFVGRVGFWNPEGWPGFEVGWMLRKKHQGKGFATEGGAACLQHAFTVLNQPWVLSVIHPDNAGSIAVAKRIGETFLESREVLGKPAVLYRITKEEWERKNRGIGESGTENRD